MEKNVYLDLGYWAQKKAKEAGADHTGIGINQSRDVEVDFRDGKVEKLKESTQQSLWIDIYSKGKFSSHSTNDLSKSSLEKFIRNAVDLTAYLEEDDFRKLAPPELYEGQHKVDIDINDPSQESVTAEERLNRAKELGALIEGKDERIISIASWFGDSHNESYLLMSNGFEGHKESTSFNHGASVSLQGKGDRKPEGWKYYSARHLEDLVVPQRTAEEALKRTQDQLGAEKVPSEQLPLLLENSNAARLLSYLLGPMRASYIQQKRSFLEGKKGEQIAADVLTILDDPTIVRGLGSKYYDGDGIAAKVRPVITNGTLDDYFVDVYYGNKMGLKPNGGGTSNLIIKPGDRPGTEIEAGLDRAILVTNWLGGNANSTTGDYSLGVAGWLIENGKRVQPITEMNISGNFSDLLMNIVEVGNDPYIHSSFRTPTILIDKVSFSGS